MNKVVLLGHLARSLVPGAIAESRKMGVVRKPLEPKAYRMKQAAELLSLPYSTLYDLVQRGELPSVQVGTGARRIILIPRTALEELLSHPSSRKPKKTRG